MHKNQDDILKDFLTEKFDDMQTQLGANTWENIQLGYKKQLRRKRQKKAAWISMAALLLLIPSLLLIGPFQPKTHEISNKKNTNIKETSPEGYIYKSRPDQKENASHMPDTTPKENTKQSANNQEAEQFFHHTQNTAPANEKNSEVISKKSHTLNHPENASDKTESITKNENYNLPLALSKAEVISIPISYMYDITELHANQMEEPVIKGTDQLTEDKPQPEEKPNKLYLKLNFSTDYSFHSPDINSSRMQEIHEDYTFIKAQSEKWNVSFSGGLNLLYRFKEKYSVQSGLFLTDYRTKADYNFTNDKIPVRDSATNHIVGYIAGVENNTVKTQVSNSYKFMEIPLIIGIEQPLTEKFYLNFKTGISYFHIFNVKGTDLSYYNLEMTKLDLETFNQSNWGIILGIGGYCKINNNFTVGMEPTYKTFTGSIYNRDDILNEKPSFLGLNTILLIKLK